MFENLPLKHYFLLCRVDPEFRAVCLSDAKRICKTDQLPEPRHETQVGGDNFQLPLSMVISCLYRNIRPSHINVRRKLLYFNYI